MRVRKIEIQIWVSKRAYDTLAAEKSKIETEIKKITVEITRESKTS